MRKLFFLLGLALLCGLIAFRILRKPDSPAVPPVAGIALNRGGTLTAAIRADPRSFNRLFTTDAASDLVAHLVHAPLMRIDRTTDQVQPWLVERVEAAADGRTYTLKLRPGVTFSDGTPFTSADVKFTFDAVYDEALGSPLADGLRVGGQPLAIATPDASTVVVTFPAGFGPALRALDGLPILPRHRLHEAWSAGTLAERWGPATPPGELAGLGPFVIDTYQPGERLVLVRNPRYWRRDAAGTVLPYLDRLVLEIVPEQNAEMLRFESGAIDLLASEIRPEDYAALKRRAEAGAVQLFDLGVGLDPSFLWFNLSPAAAARDTARPWLRRRELRQAISHALDRQALADTVYLGAGVPIHGPVTPGNKVWYSPEIRIYEHDGAKARQLLAGLGLSDRDGDGRLEDAAGRAAQFSLLTQKGSTVRERSASVIQQDLKRVGLTVDVVALDVGSLIDRFNRGDFDAIYHFILSGDTDPAAALEFWLSSGSFNPWNAAVKTPDAEWERRIDDLMRKQMAALDPAERVRLFAQAQRVFSEELPAIYFVAPRVIVAASGRVLNARPALLRPQVLWDADALAVRDAGR